MEKEFCLITTAVDDRNLAGDLARRLVESGLAACVQAEHVVSTYCWEGEVKSGDEILLMIKTLSRRYDEVEKVIRELHTYELPEILRVTIDGGFQPYLDWVKKCAG